MEKHRRRPKYPAAEGVKPEDWAEFCRRQIDNLTAWLASRNKECPHAAAALQRLKTRSPAFSEHEVISHSFERTGVIEGSLSPKSAADLLPRLSIHRLSSCSPTKADQRLLKKAALV